ncbi:MAG TPA: VanZ family protein, partial [Desulfobacteraceae bacterium]|nr:VanZ family protein [Desulfobacteraceae bacterium]
MDSSSRSLSKPFIPASGEPAAARHPVFPGSEGFQAFVVRVGSRVVLAIALLLMPWATLSPSASPPSAIAAPMHIVALAGLTVLALLSFAKVWHRVGAVVFVFGYSALMELLQYYHPERNGNMEDVGANMLGCLAGVVIYTTLK